jgi:uncharacterized protein (DUF4415 family)
MTAKSKPTKNTWVDEDDAPELTEEWFANATLSEAGQVIRRGRGRPEGSGNKRPTTVRLDNAVLDAFQATGPRWQSRLNAALVDWLKSHSPNEISV